jgi:molybdate transport system substrate-binding protein
MLRWSFVVMVLLAGCGAPQTGGPGGPVAGPSVQTPLSQPVPPRLSGELTVFAASSLTEVFTEIAQGFEAAQPGLRVTLSFGGSPQLRTQIEQGARADVFAAANVEQMDLAVRNGVVAGTPRLFAGNRLAVVVPRDTAGRVQTLADLARPGLKIVLAQRDVPVGAYAREVIQKLAAEPGASPDYAERVLRNVVSEEPNVRQVLAKVQLGEADAAIVYTTDVTPATASAVRQLPVPDGANVVARYPIARIAGSSNADAAEAFIAYVLSPAGQESLKRSGFLPP